jgi:hypothetical protein
MNHVKPPAVFPAANQLAPNLSPAARQARRFSFAEK